ncbi:MAG: hypothetical protein IJ242_15060, partial [Clostridia bacterium]|nr:hypothetical protein [Clostridia bacterium]
MNLFLAILDQLRYVAGMLASVLITCHGILPARRYFRHRIILCTLVWLFLALLYVPAQMRWGASFRQFPHLTAPYWLIMTFIPVGLVVTCYETNPAGALFRVLLSSCIENYFTVLTRYLFVLSLFPRFPEQHPIAYTGFLCLVLSIILWIAWRMLRPRIRTDES